MAKCKATPCPIPILHSNEPIGKVTNNDKDDIPLLRKVQGRSLDICLHEIPVCRPL
jgi:hypothetical protein